MTFPGSIMSMSVKSYEWFANQENCKIEREGVYVTDKHLIITLEDGCLTWPIDACLFT